ncbi:2,3-bisphosphoglycerate-dependent phosphoglycerate mutase, partial [Clarias magur]
IQATTKASRGRSSNRHQVLSISLSIPPPPTFGCGPVWPGFTLSGYLPVKANGVRMGIACPDCGSPEPALALALAPSLCQWEAG